MKKYPKDKFDDLHAPIDRVGAHRGQRPKSLGWVTFGWAALATVLLIGLGLTSLTLLEQNVAFRGVLTAPTVTETVTQPPETTYWSPAVTETPTDVVDLEEGEVVPVWDGITPVEVRNATGVAGTGEAVVAQLQQWSFNALPAVEAESAAEITTVYYPTEDLEPSALGLAENFPGAVAVLDAGYPAGQLTLVVGTDYQQ